LLEVTLYNQQVSSIFNINDEFERNIRYHEDKIFNKVDKKDIMKIPQELAVVLNEYRENLKKYFLESIRLVEGDGNDLAFTKKRRLISKEIEEKRLEMERQIRKLTVEVRVQPKNIPIASIEEHETDESKNGHLKNVETMLAELDGVVTTVQAGLFDGDEDSRVQGRKKRVPKDIDVFREISISRGIKVIDGMMVDHQTARAIVETHDNLTKEAHKEALLSLDIGSMGKIAWKFVKSIRKK
jgi:hypothetical protein